MSGELAVSVLDGPVVIPDLIIQGAEVNHRLNGQGHAWLEDVTVDGRVMVQDNKAVVEGRTNAVAGEIAHDVVAKALGIRLYNAADDVNLTAGLCCLDAAHSGLLGALYQQSMLLRDIASKEGGVIIAVHAVLIGGDINIDDVPIFNHGGIRDAVADNLVEGYAAGLRETAVAQRGRVSAMVAHVLVRHTVNIISSHTRLYSLAGLLECVGRNLAGFTHLLNDLRRLDVGFANALLYLVLPRVLWSLNALRHGKDGGGLAWL